MCRTRELSPALSYRNQPISARSSNDHTERSIRRCLEAARSVSNRSNVKPYRRKRQNKDRKNNHRREAEKKREELEGEIEVAKRLRSVAGGGVEMY